MNGGRDALDRLSPLFEPPDQPYESFLRRRDRKRRNQRIGAAALALIIAVAAVGGVLALFRSVGSERPASPPPITTRNISRLRVTWTADVGGSTWQPAVADHVVYAGTFPLGPSSASPTGKLYAYPQDCATDGDQCAPLWTASTGVVNSPTVADGVVYAAENAAAPSTSPGGTHYLYAFPTECGTGSATCRPLWRGDIGTGVSKDMVRPVIEGDVVYIATHTLYAFRVGCRSDGGLCAPLWTAPIGAPATSLVVADGRVFVGTAGRDRLHTSYGRLVAFDAACGSEAPAPCRPLWRLLDIDSVWGLTESSGVLYVGTATSLFAMPADCTGGASCDPLWTGAPRGSGGFWLGPVVDGELFAFDQNFGVYAFPADCGSGGATCQPLWKAFIVPKLSSAPPVVADGVVYVGTQNGQAYAFPTTCSDPCEPVWTTRAGGQRAWVGVTVAGGEVFVASSPMQPSPAAALSAYAIGPRTPPARSTADRGMAIVYGILVLFAASWLVVRFVRSRRT